MDLAWIKYNINVSMSKWVPLGELQVILENGECLWAGIKIEKVIKIDISGNVEWISCDSPEIQGLGI